MKRTVYRVQAQDGRGPWRPGFSIGWMEDKTPAQYMRLRPWLEQFGAVHLGARFGYHVGCGCLSVEQLREWFSPGEYATLLGHGYQAVRLDVDGILGASDVQCVFERAEPLARGVTGFDLYPIGRGFPDVSDVSRPR